jgi:hypothetical protein
MFEISLLCILIVLLVHLYNLLKYVTHIYSSDFFSITSVKEFTSRKTDLLQDKLEFYCNLYSQRNRQEWMSLIVTIIDPDIVEAFSAFNKQSS